MDELEHMGAIGRIADAGHGRPHRWQLGRTATVIDLASHRRTG